jgi:hypothetical protein
MCLLFRSVRQRRLLVTGVSGKPIGSIIKSQEVKEDCILIGLLDP